MSSKRSRTAVKTLTWRVLATTDTFLISYFITGRFDFAGAIAGIEVATKMILYYLSFLQKEKQKKFQLIQCQMFLGILLIN